MRPEPHEISGVRHICCIGEHGESRLTAVSQKVQPSSMALRSTGSACSADILVLMNDVMPIAPKPGTGTRMPAKGRVLTILLEFSDVTSGVERLSSDVGTTAWLFRCRR